MLELLSRMTAVEEILSSDLSKKNKAAEALRPLSGLDITHLHPVLKGNLKRRLAAINDVTQKYALVTTEDYGKITSKDLDQIINIAKNLCKSTYNLIKRHTIEE